MAEVTAPRPTFPIAADETVERAKDAERGEARPRLRPGDGEAVARSAGSARRTGSPRALPIYLSSALDGPLGIAAAAHAAQALPAQGPAAGLAHGLATQLLFSETIATRECALEGDLLSVPDAPGSGSRSTTRRCAGRQAARV